MEERIEELEKQIKSLLNEKSYHQIREILVDLNEYSFFNIFYLLKPNLSTNAVYLSRSLFFKYFMIYLMKGKNQKNIQNT